MWQFPGICVLCGPADGFQLFNGLPFSIPPLIAASTEIAQLLLIVSDGRGLFLEGKDRVLAAVQAAQNANIFVIFVVLDNPNSRVSARQKPWFCR